MEDEQRDRLRSKQYIEHGEAIKYRTDGRRQLWRREFKKKYKSILWLYKIMKEDREPKIKNTLERYKYFLPLLQWLLDNALSFDDCRAKMRMYKIKKVKMVAKKSEIVGKKPDGKEKIRWVEFNVKRVPILVKPKHFEIAGTLGMSEASVYKYTRAMEDSCLMIRTKARDKIKSPAAAYRIIGGWVENRYDENNEPLQYARIIPVYFWHQTSEVKQLFRNFSL